MKPTTNHSRLVAARVAFVALLAGLGAIYVIGCSKPAEEHDHATPAKAHDHADPAGEHDHSADHETAPKEVAVWTCPMHPEIQQRVPGSCSICGMALTPAKTVDQAPAPEATPGN